MYDVFLNKYRNGIITVLTDIPHIYYLKETNPFLFVL